MSGAHNMNIRQIQDLVRRDDFTFSDHALRRMLEETQIMNCYYCHGELKEELTTFVYEENGQIWVAHNVPALVCQECGEKEYTPDVTHKLYTLVKESPAPIKFIRVPVYDLARAA